MLIPAVLYFLAMIGTRDVIMIVVNDVETFQPYLLPSVQITTFKYAEIAKYSIPIYQYFV